MRVLELSLENIGNIGEELLGDTTEFLIKKENPSIEVIREQMVLSTSDMAKSYPVSTFIYLGLRAIGKYCTNSKIAFVSDRIAFRLKLYRYYKKILKNKDAVIVACGMFKFSNQNFNHVFEILTELTDYYKIPVLFSGMSIQKINNNDVRCRQLKRCLKASSLKAFTTRDGSEGIRRLRDEYKLPASVKCVSVGDPALWIKECYNIKAIGGTKVGVGLVRSKVFVDYGEDFTDSQVEMFYRDLVTALDEKGIEWQFFTNGMVEDYEFGKKLLKELGLTDDKLAMRPENAAEYFSVVTAYKTIIGARLHACISAVALGIPVIGLSWDDKFRFFSRAVGIENQFVEVEGLNGKKIAEMVQNSMGMRYASESINRLQNSMVQAISDFLKDVG